MGFHATKDSPQREFYRSRSALLLGMVLGDFFIQIVNRKRYRQRAVNVNPTPGTKLPLFPRLRLLCFSSFNCDVGRCVGERTWLIFRSGARSARNLSVWGQPSRICIPASAQVRDGGCEQLCARANVRVGTPSRWTLLGCRRGRATSSSERQGVSRTERAARPHGARR